MMFSDGFRTQDKVIDINAELPVDDVRKQLADLFGKHFPRV